MEKNGCCDFQNIFIRSRTINTDALMCMQHFNVVLCTTLCTPEKFYL